MINLIWVLIFLFQVNANAANWINVDNINAGKFPAYAEEKQCPAPCVDVGDNDPSLMKVVSSQVDDTDNPIYEERVRDVCKDELDCRELAKTLCRVDELVEIVSVSDVFDLYCKTIIAYEKKTLYAAEIDLVKKAAYDADIAQKASTVAARRAAIERLKAINFSGTTIAQVKTELRSVFMDLILALEVK